VAEFALDLEEIRRSAREHMGDGAVTTAYRADRPAVLSVLNDALATELVCVLRYKRHAFTATGINSSEVIREFVEHATEEQEHADWIASRIAQLGGEPDFDPDTLHKRSHSDYVPGHDLLEMIREDLVAERVAIATYQEIARWLGNDDPTTRRLIEKVLAVEEDHAEDLQSLLDRLADKR
jgi:bacterioferritin